MPLSLKNRTKKSSRQKRSKRKRLRSAMYERLEERIVLATSVAPIQAWAYVDVNGDGLPQSGEPGIEGVTITFTDEAGSNAQRVTDSTGRAWFGPNWPVALAYLTADQPEDFYDGNDFHRWKGGVTGPGTTPPFGEDSETNDFFQFVNANYRDATQDGMGFPQPSFANPGFASDVESWYFGELPKIDMAAESLLIDDSGDLEAEYSISEVAVTHDTNVSLFWASGTTIDDVIGDPVLSEPIPKGTATGNYPLNVDASSLTDPPSGSTHLLMIVDFSEEQQPSSLRFGKVPETDESNNIKAVALSINIVALSAETGEPNGFQWEPPEEGGGFTFTYKIVNPSNTPIPDTTIKFYWNVNGQTVHEFDIDGGNDVSGEPLKAEGSHRIHVSHDELNGDRTWLPFSEATLVMEVDPDGKVEEKIVDDNFAHLDDAPLVLHVLTHGWNSSGDKYQPYVPILEELVQPDSILDGRVHSYVSNWESTASFTEAFITLAVSKVFELRSASNPFNPINSFYAELFAALAAKIAEKSGAHAIAAANKIVEDVKSQLLSSPSESNRLQRILLFGHSRGAAVNALVSSKLASEGYRIVDFVSLDGFSTDWPNNGGVIGDISITGYATATDGLKWNYRVEEGLGNLVLRGADWLLDAIRVTLHSIVPTVPDITISNIPQFVSSFITAVGDLRAPERVGFINDTVVGTNLPTNHITIADEYFGDQTLLQTIYTASVAESLLASAAESEFVVDTETNLLPFDSINAALRGFTDGDFRTLGKILSDATATEFIPTGDLVLDSMRNALVDSGQILRFLWDTDGDARLVQDNTKTAVQLTDSLGDASLSQFVALPDRAVSVDFDLVVRSSTPGDLLSVSFAGNTLDSIELGGQNEVQHISIPILDTHPTDGTFTFTLIGTNGNSTVIEIDNIEFSYVSDPPVANAGGPYLVNEGGNVRLDASRTVDADQTAISLSYKWDFDGDGIFGETGDEATRGDEVGIAPTFFATRLAGPISISVALQVTDEQGLLSEDITAIAVDDVPFCNPAQPLDVNQDLRISPIDALYVINFIARNGFDFELPDWNVTGAFPDVNCSQGVSPVDALQVINRLGVSSTPPILSARLINDTAYGGTRNSDFVTSDYTLEFGVTHSIATEGLQLRVDGQASQPFVLVDGILSGVPLTVSESQLNAVAGEPLSDGNHYFEMKVVGKETIEDFVVTVDKTPPALEYMEPQVDSESSTDHYSIKIKFSEPVDSSGDWNQSLWLIREDDRSTQVADVVAALDGTGTFYELTFQSLVAGAYQLLVDPTKISDVAGNTLSSESVLGQFVVTGPPISWVNPNGGLWHDAANWSSGKIPTASDNVVIDAPGTYTIISPQDVSVKSLQLGGVSGEQTLSFPTLRDGPGSSCITGGPYTFCAGILSLQTPSVVGSNGVLQLYDFDDELNTVVGTQNLLDINADLVIEGKLLKAGQTIGTGTIQITDGAEARFLGLNDIANQIVNDGTIKLASHLILRNELENNGLIEFENLRSVETRVDVYEPITHPSSGTIHVRTGQRITLQSPAFANHGRVEVDEGGELTFSGVDISQSDGLFRIEGTLIATDSTLAFAEPLDAKRLELFSSSYDIDSGAVEIDLNQSLFLFRSDVNADVNNMGTIEVSNFPSNITGQITTTEDSIIHLQINGQLSTPLGFTNLGTIFVDGSGGLSTGSGTLVNATNSEIVFRDASAGSIAYSPATLTTSLDNQGTLSIIGGLGLNLSSDSADQVNTGIINVTAAPLTIFQSGETASFVNIGSISLSGGDLILQQSEDATFTNSGVISLDSSQRIDVKYGTFHHQSGSITGGGLLKLNNASAIIDTAVQLDAIDAEQSVIDYVAPLSTANAALALRNSVYNSPQAITNASGETLTLFRSTINADVNNLGMLEISNTSNQITGQITTVAGSGIHLTINGQLSTSTGFTNHGQLIIYGSGAVYAGGNTMVNGPTGEIITQHASAGSIAYSPATINAVLDNQGTLSIVGGLGLNLNSDSADHVNAGMINATAAPLTIFQSGETASFVNSGTISLSGGDLILQQSEDATFTNSGVISLDSSQRIDVKYGTFHHQSGSITGGGLLKLNNASAIIDTAVQLDAIDAEQSVIDYVAPLSTANAALALRNSVYNSPQAITNASGETLTLFRSTINADVNNLGMLEISNTSNQITGQITTVAGSGIHLTINGQLSTSTGFTNHGQLIIYGSGAVYAGGNTLVNGPTGEIITQHASAGSIAYYPATINAVLDNQGTLSIVGGLGLNLNSDSANHVNAGIINVTAAPLKIIQSGETATFTNSGSIVISADQSLEGIGGDFILESGSAVQIGVKDLSTYGFLDVDGGIVVDGNLTLDVIGDFSPDVGASFEILICDDRNGEFASVTGINLLNGRHFVLEYDSTGVLVNVESPPLAPVGSTIGSMSTIASRPHTLPLEDFFNIEAADVGFGHLPQGNDLSFTQGTDSQANARDSERDFEIIIETGLLSDVSENGLHHDLLPKDVDAAIAIM